MIRFAMVNISIVIFLYFSGFFVSYNNNWIVYNEITRFSVIVAWMWVTVTQAIVWEEIKTKIWGEKK